MSIAHVQNLTTVAAGSSTSLQSGAFGSSPTTGNSIIVTVWLDTSGGGSPTVSSITDTAGNTYVKDAAVGPRASGESRCEVWRAANITGGASFKLTVTCSHSAFITFTAAEFSGVANTSPLDGTGSTNTGPGLSSPPSTGAFSTTNANDLLLVTFASAIHSDPGTPSGFTRIGDEVGTGIQGGDAQFQIVSATQSGINPTWSSATVDDWSCIGLAYQAAGAGGGGGFPWFIDGGIGRFIGA